LKSTSRLLSFDFDVVGTASDGLQAIEAAQRLDPDLIALDITMPGRDGFQTAQDLVQMGTRARIVFLTMHEADDYVAEAFRSGGRGYVLKTRLHLDLTRALQRVLAGQLYVPSIGSLLAIDENITGHAVLYRDDDRGFVDSISGLLSTSLRRRDVVAVASTQPIRAGIARRLRADGWNVGESGEFGHYRAIDAAAALASVMRNGHPDADLMRELVGGLERTRAMGPRGAESRLTFAGEIAAQLVAEGNVEGALEMEHIWNDLTSPLPFLTICSYPMSPLDGADERVFPHLCAEHFAVAHTPESASRSLRM
jgi:CheY-like chemotaxis protein